MANEVTIRVTAEDHASKPIQGIRGRVSEMALGFGTGLVATTALAGGMRLLADQVGSSISAFMESEVATAKLNAVLTSTGGAAGVTADEAQRLATELQHLTGTSDEEIINAQTLLLTFTKIGADIFPQATEAALNMSTVFGQDLSSSAIQLGKALNDPIAGVGALRRVGVQLTDQQEEAIKKFVELGEVEKAQAVILQELQVEVGGAAVAFGETATGKIAIFSQSIDDMKERLGGALVEGLTPLIDQLNAWTQTEEAEKFVDNLVVVFGGLAQALVFTARHTDELVQVFKALNPAVGAVGPLFNAASITISAIDAVLDSVRAKVDGTAVSFERLGLAIRGALGGAAGSIAGTLLGPLAGVGEAIEGAEALLEGGGRVLGFSQGNVDVVVP